MHNHNSKHITLLDIIHSSSGNIHSPPSPHTILGIHHHLSSDTFELNDSSSDLPLPSSWEKCLDMETGRIYYRHRDTGSRSFTDPRIINSPNYSRYPNNGSLHSPSDQHQFSGKASPAASDSVALSISSSNPNDNNINIHKVEEKTADTLIDLDLSLSLGSNASKQQGTKAIARQTHQLQQYTSDEGDLGVNIIQNKASDNAIKQQNSLSNRRVVKSTALTSSSISALKFEDGHLVYESNNVGSQSPTLQYNVLNQSTTTASNSPMITMGCLNCFMFVVIPRGSKEKCPSCGLLLNLNLESKLDFPLLA